MNIICDDTYTIDCKLVLFIHLSNAIDTPLYIGPNMTESSTIQTSWSLVEWLMTFRNIATLPSMYSCTSFDIRATGHVCCYRINTFKTPDGAMNYLEHYRKCNIVSKTSPCRYEVGLIVDMRLDSLSIWGWAHCRYEVGLIVDMRFDSLSIWGWAHCRYEVGLIVDKRLGSLSI